MDRNIREYQRLGGTYQIIADCWGKSKQYVGQLVKRYGDDLRVEFENGDIGKVRRLYTGPKEHVFFEREYGSVQDG